MATVPSIPMVVVADEKTSGTNGGTFTAGAWRTRDLNTLIVNDDTTASLSSNQVTLPAGTYECWISASAFDVNAHMIRLQDITGTATIATGSAEFARNGDAGSMTRSFVYSKFTLSVSSALEVQHRSSGTKATNGFGVASGFETNTYTTATFRKVG